MLFGSQLRPLRESTVPPQRSICHLPSCQTATAAPLPRCVWMHCANASPTNSKPGSTWPSYTGRASRTSRDGVPERQPCSIPHLARSRSDRGQVGTGADAEVAVEPRADSAAQFLAAGLRQSHVASGPLPGRHLAERRSGAPAPVDGNWAPGLEAAPSRGVDDLRRLAGV